MYRADAAGSSGREGKDGTSNICSNTHRANSRAYRFPSATIMAGQPRKSNRSVTELFAAQRRSTSR